MRLGDEETGDSGGTAGNVATAYGHGSRNSKTLLFIALIALGLLFLKNSFTKDYKQSTKDYLLRAGVDETRIEKYVPKTVAEIKEEKLSEKQQIEWLVTHVQMLEAQLNATNTKLESQYKELSGKINN